MSHPHFVERKNCPACSSVELRELFHGSYTEPPISSWLEKRLAPKGMVEFDLLEGAEYVLMECSSCALIFQRDIPDEFMAEIAYERWVIPTKPGISAPRTSSERADATRSRSWACSTS